MAGEFDASAAAGAFKDVFGGMQDVRVGCSVLQKLFPFTEGQRVGDQYIEMVEVKMPQGLTYTGAATSVTALNAAVNGAWVQASASSYETILREQVQYKVFTQARSSGKTSYVAGAEAVATGMNRSLSNRLELALLRGQYGLGEIESIDDQTTYANVTITADTWCPSLWYALLGGYVDSMTGTTKNNTGTLLVDLVTNSTRTIKLTASGTVANDLTVGDILFPKGSHGATPTDFAGLIQQAKNTSSSMLGISPTTYPNWAGNTASVGGPISWRVLEDNLHIVRSRASEVAADGWYAFAGRAYGALAAETAEAGRFTLDNNSRAVKAGLKAINYNTFELGDIELVFHPFMSDGHILLIPKNSVKRIGASDIAFGVPGEDGERKLFTLVAGYNAIELQAIYDQAIMLLKPSCAHLLTGITY